MPQAYLKTQLQAQQLRIELQGEWRLRDFDAIETALSTVDLSGAARVSVDTHGVELDFGR